MLRDIGLQRITFPLLKILEEAEKPMSRSDIQRELSDAGHPISDREWSRELLPMICSHRAMAHTDRRRRNQRGLLSEIKQLGSNRGRRYFLEGMELPETDEEIAERLYLLLRDSKKEFRWAELLKLAGLSGEEIIRHCKSSNIQRLLKEVGHEKQLRVIQGSKRGFWVIEGSISEKGLDRQREIAVRLMSITQCDGAILYLKEHRSNLREEIRDLRRVKE